MKTAPLSNWKIQTALTSAILSLLVVGAVLFRGAAMSDGSERQIRHTHEVLENLGDLLLPRTEQNRVPADTV